jgi:hypothetical protein
MTKYYIALLLCAGAALFYVFTKDPCNQAIRADFAGRYPDYEILDSGAGEGSPEVVQCHIAYLKPNNQQVYEDIWTYENSAGDWVFSGAIETRERPR